MPLAAPDSGLDMDRVSFLVQGVEATGSDQGAGEPLLLVHGWGAGSTHWRRVWPSRPPSTAHSAKTVGPGSNSRGCHSPVSWSSSA